VRTTGDTLLLSGVGSCQAGTFSGAISVLRVDHGSRWKHVAIGFAGGAAIGGIAARLAAGDGCTIDPCDDGGLAVGLMTIGGIVIGAASGLLIGAALPAGKDWEPPQSVGVLRVGSVTLRPEIRLSWRTRTNNSPHAR
jgi:hypothetical protein